MKCMWCNCGAEMIEKKDFKESTPLVYKCKVCGAYTVVRTQGLCEHYNPNGELFSPNSMEGKNSNGNIQMQNVRR